MNSGGGVTWREWEMEEEVARSREKKLILLLDPLLPNVCILFCKIYVGPFQTTVWIIPGDASVQTKAEKKFLNYLFFL